ncbi:SUMF1/EgtB/PvdO family nonheme iron enzyme [Caldimonas brevitalea]|uniref:Serine/threonine kinase n=1 Tax=Caldimonas brevitalea TaxID=413882 RepID=A0A0G3BL66_9BURK|nr:SUMF1/EgtB/PvdO family nonheme iron enzyme [Caldimonas brevitalea]AKJ28116.1 serine/threonine kinase [Caldimonas brevitalea]
MDIDTPDIRRSGRDLLSLALIDSRNCSLHRFSAFEASLDIPPTPELDPPLWLLGHLGWFQEYWVARNIERHLGPYADARRPRLASIEPGADLWYDPAQTPRAGRWRASLPPPDTVRAYLVETLEATLDLLNHAEETDKGLYFFRLALFYEDMQGETLACMAHTLGLSVPALQWPQPIAERSPIGFGAMRWQLGCDDGPGFVFDHEMGRHEVRVPEFEIDAQPVNWAQYAEFIEDGGYDEASWWSAEGWAWLQATGRRAPRHVEQVRHRVLARRGADLVQLAAQTPAMHVSWHEAQAWCRWAGRRLPSEAEWELAACTAASRGFRWGDVWEWTSSRFEPYGDAPPGAATEALQIPRDGSHRVLRGGSFATRWRLKHPRQRGFQRPERDDTFCGFRTCAL